MADLAAPAMLAGLPPAPPEPEPIRLQWFAAELRSGRIVEELPALTPSGSLSRRVGAATTTSFALTLAGAPDGWEAATDPGRTMIVAVADEVPVWAGMVLTRKRGSAPTAELGCATPEAYFDRRYTKDHTWTQVDEAVIASGLIGDTQVDGLGLTIDAPATGTTRDRTYLDADDASVLSRLQELMGVVNGPEFTIDVRWRGAGQSRFELVARVRKRLGVQSATPNAVFSYPGSVTEYDLLESYEAGRGANVVRARGEGEGEDRYTSADMVATELLAAGWPRYEHRFTPSTSITSQSVLDSHARNALAVLRYGSRVWALKSRHSKGPRLGADFGLCDTVGLHVITSPGHLSGAAIAARALAWEWDTVGDVIAPIIAEDDDGASG